MVVPRSVTDPTAQLKLPPGFRFYPTDEELMVKYLFPKVDGRHSPLQIIGDVDLYKFDPWELPSKAMFGEKEWYFFSPRDRKYPNGTRPNRVAGSGYWKATGTDKVIMSNGRKVGIKKALVFYVGKAPTGSKTNWIMHEYRLSEPSAKDSSIRLDDWVLCRIYRKNSGAEKTITGGPSIEPSHGSPSSACSQFDDALDSLPVPAIEQNQNINIQPIDPGNYDWMGAYPFVLQDPINNYNSPNLTSVDPNFNMQMRFVRSPDEELQNGIRSERMANSGYLHPHSFVSSTDPFAIRYPPRQGRSGSGE